MLNLFSFGSCQTFGKQPTGLGLRGLIRRDSWFDIKFYNYLMQLFCTSLPFNSFFSMLLRMIFHPSGNWISKVKRSTQDPGEPSALLFRSLSPDATRGPDRPHLRSNPTCATAGESPGRGCEGRVSAGETTWGQHELGILYIAIVGCYGFPGLFFIFSLHFVPHHNSFRLYLTLLKDSKLFILFCFMLCFFPLGFCVLFISAVFFILQFGPEIKNINPPNGCS